MSSNIINIDEIIEMIPHRYPFLLIDKILDYKPGESALGIKNVTMNEPQFTGHFPGRPIMPGVLIIESMAQTSAVLVLKTLQDRGEGKLVYFMSIEEAKFRRTITPGDVMYIYVEKLQNRANVWKFSSRIEIEGKLAAEAIFSAMIMDKK
jgi:3-hydroxyacyl-[acyl-carrier-protein] dehydratase